MKKIAFILGVTGQDGAYLSNLLIKKNYKVYGFTRNLGQKNVKNLKILNVLNHIKLKKINFNNGKPFINFMLKIKPAEIYYFSGQSSVGKSFQKPIETYDSNSTLLFLILETLRKYSLNNIKVYNSVSTDCFGKNNKIFNTEKDEFNPQSPYAKAKYFSFWLVKFYREKYGLHCKNGILSNHESFFRDKNFVLKKIINFAQKRKKDEILKLGDISVYRDWGWAPDYVEAIYKINNAKKNIDYVVGTGKLTSLKSITSKLFAIYKINKKYLKINNSKSIRLKEVKKIGTLPQQILKDLGWKSKTNLKSLINKLVNNKLY